MAVGSVDNRNRTTQDHVMLSLGIVANHKVPIQQSRLPDTQIFISMNSLICVEPFGLIGSLDL